MPLGLSVVQPRRSRGAQVFTYRELERATDGFSEGNVLGRGPCGVVYLGRLGDGTPAAIKRLQLDLRRQGEREFRVEVINKQKPHVVTQQLTFGSIKIRNTYVLCLVHVPARTTAYVRRPSFSYRPVPTSVVAEQQLGRTK